MESHEQSKSNSNPVMEKTQEDCVGQAWILPVQFREEKTGRVRDDLVAFTVTRGSMSVAVRFWGLLMGRRKKDMWEVLPIEPEPFCSIYDHCDPTSFCKVWRKDGAVGWFVNDLAHAYDATRPIAISCFARTRATRCHTAPT